MNFTLENLLDSEETTVEAVIDLTHSTRFALAPAESASKTIALIDSHATVDLNWKLIPQPAPKAEEQEIVVRYRSEQMTVWEECRTTVIIESWPEEISVVCATGGHDSLYADSHYEQFIPDPLHVSYTVTNTGTVALTGCEASIILPPVFALAGSDSTQNFTAPVYANEPGGPVLEGTILPNASCTRWWKITPTQAIADTAPKLIRWRWTSDQQGSISGCADTIFISPDAPRAIVFTPLHLYFETERGGALPAEQNVQLWTGGGLSMPWTMQPSESWLGVDPINGNQEATVAVQPNSTLLDVGAHAAELLVNDQSITVTYNIRSSTGIANRAAPAMLSLQAWPQPVTVGGMLHILFEESGKEGYQLSIYDLLGRERISHIAETSMQLSIDINASKFSPGSYILRVTTPDGKQASRLISVIR